MTEQIRRIKPLPEADDDPGSMYMSAVFVEVGGVEVAGLVRADALARIEALIADDMTPPPTTCG